MVRQVMLYLLKEKKMKKILKSKVKQVAILRILFGLWVTLFVSNKTPSTWKYVHDIFTMGY